MRRIVAVSIVAMAAVAVAQAADWPQYNGPNRNGASAESGLMTEFPADGPKVLWSVPVGKGWGGAAIEAGKVYLLDREDEQADVLRVLDLETGKELASYRYEAPGKLSHDGSRQTPTVGEKYVFAVGPFGDFHCFDKATGQPVWRKHLLKDWGGEIPRWGVAQAPLLHKDRVIVAPMSSSVGAVALDQATGRELWRSKPVGSLRYASPVLVTLGGAEQVIVQSADRVAALDPQTGAILWTYDYACRNAIPYPTPVGASGLFLTGGYEAGSVMLQVAGQGGRWAARPVWTTDKGSQIPQPILVGRHLYAVCNTNGQKDGLVCFDAATGAVAWATGRQPSFSMGDLLLTGDGVIYAMDSSGSDGELVCFRPTPDGYQELSRAKVIEGKELWAPMALSDGRLIVRDQGRMKCLDLRKPRAGVRE